MSKPDPQSVTCPHCHADAGEPCTKPDGAATKTHARRVTAAEASAASATRALVPDRITGDRWRRLYRTCRLELEGRADWSAIAAEQLEAMVKSMSMADTCRDRAAKSPLVAGRQDSEVSNPLNGVALRYDAHALAVAAALRLTPATRGTSAPAGADAEDDDPDEDKDEFSELDELARRRREARASGAPHRAARRRK